MYLASVCGSEFGRHSVLNFFTADDSATIWRLRDETLVPTYANFRRERNMIQRGLDLRSCSFRQHPF